MPKAHTHTYTIYAHICHPLHIRTYIPHIWHMCAYIYIYSVLQCVRTHMPSTPYALQHTAYIYMYAHICHMCVCSRYDVYTYMQETYKRDLYLSKETTQKTFTHEKRPTDSLLLLRYDTYIYTQTP